MFSNFEYTSVCQKKKLREVSKVERKKYKGN
jgi:hypothetical protein